MPNNILKSIADNPQLFKALEEVLYKQAVRAKLEGALMIEGILREIASCKSVSERTSEPMQGR